MDCGYECCVDCGYDCCVDCCIDCCVPECCSPCCCDPCNPCKPKGGKGKSKIPVKPKTGNTGSKTTAKKGACTGGGLGASTSPALCGQASFLSNKGGNYNIDALKGLTQMAPDTMKAEGGLAYSSGSSVDECSCCRLPDVTVTSKKPPKSSDFICTFACYVEKQMPHPKNCNPEMLVNKSRVSLSPVKTELQALKQLKSGICGHAEGGLPDKYKGATPKGHNPEFITGLTGYYACGGGTGQSDDIPAMLHDGDYVMDAETVSALGDGSSKAGMHVLDGFRHQIPHHGKPSGNPVPAKIADGEYVFPSSFVTALGGGDNKRGAEILDGLREKLRAHKRAAPLDKIPPKAKSPLDYIKKGTK